MQPLQTKSTFLTTAAIMSLLLLTTSHNVFAQQQQQQQKKGLVVVSDNGFNDNDPDLPQYHIVGEVQNNGAETAKFVEVSATLYDSNNKVVGTESTFPKPSDIDPGQKAPFEITVGTNDVMGGDLSVIDHYAVQASS
jgi:hypothetical protein